MNERQNKNKIFVYGLMVLLLASPVVADFFPSNHTNLEGLYNISNVSGICFSDGTCLSTVPTNLTGGSSVSVNTYSIAIMFSFFATAGIFLWIYNSINPSDEVEKPIYNVWYLAFKFMFLIGALLMTMVGILSGLAMLEAGGVNTSGASGISKYVTMAYQLDQFIVIAFVTLVVFGAVIAFISKSISLRKPKE